ncbi:MAG: hypothetical protein PSW75_00585 [bacterium]|nr:hypothetical protein [bacterium]MDI1335099.1 hypothetical protein [Lacunisphaera sp.]
MSITLQPLRPGQTRLLWASFLINVTGMLFFLPPLAPLRTLFGLPEAPAFYLWLVASWILILGLGYLAMALAGKLNRPTLAVGAACKITFGLLVLGGVASGRFPVQASALALTDLGLAALYLRWLRE